MTTTSTSIKTGAEIINPPGSPITNLMNQLLEVNKQRQAFAVGDNKITPLSDGGGGKIIKKKNNLKDNQKDNQNKKYRFKQITGYGKKRTFTIKANNLETAIEKGFSKMKGGSVVFQINEEIFVGTRTKNGSHINNEIKQIY
jgi:hypothetical protein